MASAGTVPERRRVALALAALVLGACAMGASPVFVRLADVGPFASAFWRTFLALPFLWAWMRFAEAGATAPIPGAHPARRRAALRPVVLAGLFFTGDLFFWHLSILGTTVANATFFATTAPIWVALTAWVIASEKVDLRTLFGLGLCLAGGFALIGQSCATRRSTLPAIFTASSPRCFSGSISSP